MSYTPKRLYPEFNWPVDRGLEQYNQYVKLFGVAEKMREYGVSVDTQRALHHVKEAAKRQQLFTELFLKLTGLKAKDLGDKGTGNSKKVREWFIAAGAPDVVFDKKTKKPQFNAAALTCWASDYADKDFAKPAAALLGLRKAVTNGRFAMAYYMVAKQHQDRIHFNLNPLGTKGLRWSASEKFIIKDDDGNDVVISLNAQNVPSKNSKYDFGPGYGVLPLLVSLRDIFVPAPGCVWMKFDYESAEAVLQAYNTGDALLLQWLKEGADLHTENAKTCFLEAKIPVDIRKIEKGSPFYNHRDAMKNGQYAWPYQISSADKDLESMTPADVTKTYPESWKFFKQLFPNMQETYFGTLILRFMRAHGGIKAWQLDIGRRVMQDGYVTLPQNGRTIYVAPNAKGKNMSGNFFMQSGLGFLINRATPDVAAMCDWGPCGLALLLQVHDELDLQCPENRVDEVDAAVSALLSAPANFGGMTGGISAAPDVGPNWNEVKSRKKAA